MDPVTSFSRRDFLKISGLGLIGFFLPFPRDSFELMTNFLASNQQGRVTDASINIYEKPSLESKITGFSWRDIVLPITGISVSEQPDAYNRVWYQVNGNGFVYSGSIQPVKTVLNTPVQVLQRKIVLAEVTVPFTDARAFPKSSAKVMYRFYYETTHWVEQVVFDEENEPWYRVSDEKFERHQFVPARHLRLVPDEELTLLSPQIPPDQKRIEVQLSKQLVIAFEADKPVFMTRAATGGSFNRGIFATPQGRHMTFHKRPSAHMAAGNLAANGFDLPGVPWVSYITESGVAFHGTYWHNDFGRPRSHGCINIPSQAARWIYRWTEPVVPPELTYQFLDYGTRVDVIP